MPDSSSISSASRNSNTRPAAAEADWRLVRAWAGEQPDVDHEGDDDAEGDLSVQGEKRADDADGDVTQVPDKVHHRHHQAGEELALPAGIVELLI